MDISKNNIKLPRANPGFLYPDIHAEDAKARLNLALDGFHRVFGKTGPRLFSAPGRTELCGNHTDQIGRAHV
jgi:hypothetical protein